MTLAFVLDENLPLQLAHAIRRHSLRSSWPLDVVRIGEPNDLPLGSTDPTILLWAERENRILISADFRTLPDHLAAHLAAGHHSPGVLLVRPETNLNTLVDYLVLVAYASDDYEWRDRIEFIP